MNARTLTATELEMIAAMGNSVVDQVPEELYHRFPALSYGGLKELKNGPGYLRHYMDHYDDKDTPARLLGRMIHMAILEPERFATTVVAVDGNRNAKAVKEEILEAEAKGKQVVKPDLLDRCRRVADMVRSHAVVKDLLSVGRPEQTLLWKDPATGVQMKARADWDRGDGILTDLKTFDNLSEAEIERQVRRMKYQWQTAHYLNGMEAITGKKSNDFAHVFIRTEDPIDCVVYALSDHDIDEARLQIAPYVELYSNCLKADRWPMSPQVMNNLVLRPFFD